MLSVKRFQEKQEIFEICGEEIISALNSKIHNLSISDKEIWNSIDKLGLSCAKLSQGLEKSDKQSSIVQD